LRLWVFGVSWRQIGGGEGSKLNSESSRGCVLLEEQYN
jgi:hypothetical protein